MTQDPYIREDILALLKRVWDSQPTVSLGELIGALSLQGLGFATPDEDARELLTALLIDQPDTLSTAQGTYLLSTSTTSLLIDAHTCVVLPNNSGREVPSVPTVWQYRQLIQCRAGWPLIIASVEGNHHPLGTLNQIRRLATPALAAKEVSFFPNHSPSGQLPTTVPVRQLAEFRVLPAVETESLTQDADGQAPNIAEVPTLDIADLVLVADVVSENASNATAGHSPAADSTSAAVDARVLVQDGAVSCYHIGRRTTETQLLKVVPQTLRVGDRWPGLLPAGGAAIIKALYVGIRPEVGT